MQKRSVLLHLGFCLLFFLASCKPQVETSTTTPDATHPAPTQTKDLRTATATRVPEINVDLAKLEGFQISFIHPWADETGRVMDILVDEFNQSNEWGIHVLINEPGSLGLALEALDNTDLQPGEIDLAVLPTYELLYQDQLQNKVVDLNPYVNSSKFGFSDDQVDDFTPVFWNENLVDGKLYGVPAEETAPVLFYNVTWAQELGFSYAPLTTAAFKIQTCAANVIFRLDSDSSNDGVGGWIIDMHAGTLYSWLNTFNALDEDLSINDFSSDETAAAFEYLFNLQKDACAWDSRLPEPYDYFASRQALVYSGIVQDIIAQTAAFERSENNDQWQVITYPSQPDPLLLTEGLSYGIFQSDEESQLAAWLFIRWLSQPSNQARLLQTTGSLPLGSNVLPLMESFENEYPRWKSALELLPNADTVQVDKNSGVVNVVLEDAGTFLFRTEFTTERIQDLLTEMNETIQELSEQQP